jgi:hypothetical protein
MAVTINIPSQVKTYANLAAFPASGSLKTIYIAEDTNKTYRWDGSTYVEISASAATGLTVGTTPISSGTIGRVLFEGTGNVLQQSSSLFWDSTNNRLGIGTSTPTFRLEVQGGDVRFANGLTIGTAGSAGWQFSSNTLQIIQNGFIGVDVAGGRHFNITNTAFSTYYFRVAPTTGNILIGTSTDAGFKLDVNGTARVNTLTIGLGTGQVSTNTAIGSSALLTNTTGSENTAVGFDALRANTTGQSNVAVGRNAMTSNTTGGNNASFGRFALRNNTTGTANTSLGNSAMNDNTTGGFNIGIGSNSLVTNTSGSNNIGIGANCSSGNFDASIILGRDATATASNQFVVGSTTYNAGSVTTEVNVSTQVWNVVINGVARKILLA